MSGPFHIDSDPMMRESNRLLDAVEKSASEHSGHHGELEAAVPQMWGQSKGALEKAHEALVDRASTLHHQLTEHGVGMQEFTGRVLATEQHNSERLS